MCTRLQKMKLLLKNLDTLFTLPINFNEQIQSNYNHGQTREKGSVSGCDGKGHIKHIFETYATSGNKY